MQEWGKDIASLRNAENGGEISTVPQELRYQSKHNKYLALYSIQSRRALKQNNISHSPASERQEWKVKKKTNETREKKMRKSFKYLPVGLVKEREKKNAAWKYDEEKRLKIDEMRSPSWPYPNEWRAPRPSRRIGTSVNQFPATFFCILFCRFVAKLMQKEETRNYMRNRKKKKEKTVGCRIE